MKAMAEAAGHDGRVLWSESMEQARSLRITCVRACVLLFFIFAAFVFVCLQLPLLEPGRTVLRARE